MKRGFLLFVGLICFSLASAKVETKEIKGKVLSAEDNMTMIGATVFVDAKELSRVGIEGKQYAGITDLDGNFRIDVPISVNQITVSYVGYKSQKLTIGDKNFFAVSLKTDAQQIEEVVVTGYGRIAKHKYTGSLTQVRMDKIEQIGVASVENMLEGKLAGVQSMVTSGAPGAKARISIRGTTSFSGNKDPLWVVDGVAIETPEFNDFNDNDLDIDNLENTSIGGLNPQDIAGITVLKDAAATAIYGARAANGVIVVTTKKGKKGSLQVSATATSGVVLVPDYSKLNLLNSNQKVDLELELLKEKGYTYRSNRGGVVKLLNRIGELNNYRNFGLLTPNAKNELDKLRNANNDLEDELFQLALNQDYSLAISGGSEKATYYTSVGYHKEKGTVIGTGLDRVNLSFKLAYQFNDKLKIGLSKFTTYRKSQSYLTQAGSHTNLSVYARTANPYLRLKNDDGTYYYDPDVQSNQTLNQQSGDLLNPFKYPSSVKYNVLEERENTSHHLNSLNDNTTVDIEYKIFKGLTFTSQLSMQKENSTNEKTASEETYYIRDYLLSSAVLESQYKEDYNSGRYNWWKNEDTPEGKFYTLPQGGYRENVSRGFEQYSMKNLLNYTKEFNKKHDVSVMIGNEVRKNELTSTITRQVGYNFQTLHSQPYVPAQISSRLSSRYRPNDQNYEKNAFISYFGTASYSYKRKYTLFGSVRYDGTNLFGVSEQDKFTPIWALSGSWRVTQEPFMKDQDLFQNLALRLSYGLQGNVDNSASPHFIGEYASSKLLGGTSFSTIKMSSLPNPNLTWERTENYNLGVDFTVLDSKINSSIEVYYRYSTDLLSLISIPSENGNNFASSNWGEMSNKGVEFSLSSQNIRTKNFEWTSSINISKNINQVEKQNVRSNSTTPSKVGYAFSSYFGLKTAGYDKEGNMQYYDKDGNIKSGLDLFMPNGKEISLEEMLDLLVHIGDADPDFTGGISNRFKYKNFGLSISASFVVNQGFVQEAPYKVSEFDRGLNTTKEVLERWTPTNTGAKYPKIYQQSSNNPTETANYKLYQTARGGKDLVNAWDIWYKELSYLRINSVKFSYNFNPKMIKPLGFESLGLSLEGRNLFVISSDFDGYFDPETYGTKSAQPIPRSINLGLNIRF